MRSIAWKSVVMLVLFGLLGSTVQAVNVGGTGWPKPSQVTGLRVENAHLEGGVRVLDSLSPTLVWDKPATPFWDFKIKMKRGSATVFNGFADWWTEDDEIRAEFGWWEVEFKPGTYTVLVYAYSPNAQVSVVSETLTFVVPGEPTPVPLINEPAAGSVIELLRNMRWDEVANAKWYQWMVKKPSGGTFASGTVGYGYGYVDPETTYFAASLTKELPVGAGYKLLVRAYTSRGGWGAYDTNVFDVVAPAARPGAPDDVWISQWFQYGTSPGDTGPRVEAGCWFDDNGDYPWFEYDLRRGSAAVFKGWQRWPWYRTPVDQKPGVYTLRMRAWNVAGAGDWSVTVTNVITTTTNTPAAPTNLDSTRTWSGFSQWIWGEWDNPYMLSESTPYFRWDIVDSCYQYQVQVLKDGSVKNTSPWLDLEYNGNDWRKSLWNIWTDDNGDWASTSTAWTGMKSLADGAYTWRVRAKNGMSNKIGNWSVDAPLAIDTTTSLPILWAPTGTNAASTDLMFLIGSSTNKLGEVSADGYAIEFKRSIGATNYTTAFKTDWYIDFGDEDDFDPITRCIGGNADVLFPIGQYTWKVTPINANGKKGAPATGTFWLDDNGG